MVFQLASTQSICSSASYTQHAKQIILYDLETKTIKGVERMKFLNMNYLI